MFILNKGNRFYLVENHREQGKVKQKTIRYLGVNPVSDEYIPKLNTIHHCDVSEFLAKFPDDSVDVIIADPPYFVSQDRTFKRKEKPIVRDFGNCELSPLNVPFKNWSPVHQ